MEMEDEKQDKEKLDRMGLVTTYGPHWDHLKTVLGKHWHLLMLNNRLKQILGPRSNLIAKCAPTIGDALVHSEYTHRKN